MDKRLAKRHKRQVAREKLHVKLSEPDVRTPEQIKEAREKSRRAAPAQPVSSQTRTIHSPKPRSTRPQARPRAPRRRASSPHAEPSTRSETAERLKPSGCRFRWCAAKPHTPTVHKAPHRR